MPLKTTNIGPAVVMSMVWMTSGTSFWIPSQRAVRPETSAHGVGGGTHINPVRHALGDQRHLGRRVGWGKYSAMSRM